MPSALHQTLVDLLRRAPELVAQLLTTAGGAETGEVCARVIDAVLDQIERRVDLAVELSGADGLPVRVGVEVQLSIDLDKLRSWPVYVTTMRSRGRPRACLLVLTPNRRVAAWAARPIDLGPGNPEFRVHVLGPDHIPRITDPLEARRHPELGFLSALAHARTDDDPRLVRAALAGLTALDKARGSRYGSVLRRVLSRSIPVAMEATVLETQQFPEFLEVEDEFDCSPYDPTEETEEDREFVQEMLRFGRMIVAQAEARAAREAAEEAARQAGREVGLQEGREVGLQEGLLIGRREVLMHLLARGGLQPTEAERQRISGCAEPAVLDRWIDQAIGASSVAAALA